MKFALHRSLIFWAGLLTILFIAWAWRDARGHVSTLNRGRWEVSSTGQGVWLGWQPMPVGGWAWRREPLDADDFPYLLEPRATPFFVRMKAHIGMREYVAASESAADTMGKFQASAEVRGPGSWFLYLPYRHVLSATALLWSALLVWRFLRRKRALAPRLSRS